MVLVGQQTRTSSEGGLRLRQQPVYPSQHKIPLPSTCEPLPSPAVWLLLRARLSVGQGAFVAVVPDLAPLSLARAEPPPPPWLLSLSLKQIQASREAPPSPDPLLGALVLSFSAPTPNGSRRNVGRHPSTGAPVCCRVLEELPQPTLPLALAPDRQRQQTHLVHPIRRCCRIDL